MPVEQIIIAPSEPKATLKVMNNVRMSVTVAQKFAGR